MHIRFLFLCFLSGFLFFLPLPGKSQDSLSPLRAPSVMPLPSFQDSISPASYQVPPVRFQGTGRLIVPASLAVAGITSSTLHDAYFNKKIADFRKEQMPSFETDIDDYMQYAPIAICYGMDLLGFQARTDIKNRTVILAKAQILGVGTAFMLKNMIHETRPDGSNHKSFPSGHTTEAFIGATLLAEEYKDRYPWVPYVSYAIAGSVGAMRIANNKHYLGDVLTGAALGYLSTKIAYWTHKYRW